MTTDLTTRLVSSSTSFLEPGALVPGLGIVVEERLCLELEVELELELCSWRWLLVVEWWLRVGPVPLRCLLLELEDPAEW